MAFPTNWNYKVRFNINVSADTLSGNSVTGFTVGINSSASNFPKAQLFSGQTKSRINGGDVRFSSDIDGLSALPLDIELHDQTTSACMYWVKLPDTTNLASTTVPIWMWWGVGATYQPAPSSSNGSQKVWSSYGSVLHLNTDPTLNSTKMLDSTSAGNNYNSGNKEEGDLVTGLLGKALDFNTPTDYIQYVSPTSAQLDTSIGTISMVIKPDDWDSPDPAPRLLSMSNGSDRFEIFEFTSTEFRFKYGNNDDYISFAGRPAEDAYNVVQVTWDASLGIAELFWDGVLKTSANVGTWTKMTPGGNLKIGDDENGSNSYNGIIDEYRVTNGTKRNYGWLRAEYLNLIQQSNFVSAGNVENVGLIFPNDWSRKALMVYTSASVSGTFDSFPLLLKSAQITPSMWSQIQSDAGDLRISRDKAGTSAVALEVVKWNSATSGAEVWFNAPTSSATGASVYLWWLPTKVQSQAVEDTLYGQFKVWDDYYHMVQHMEYKNDYSTFGIQTFVDSTSSMNNANSVNGNLPLSGTGQLGTSQTFDGNGDYVSIPHHASLNMGTDLMFHETIFKTPSVFPTAETGKMEIVMKRQVTPTWHNYEMQINNDDSPQANKLNVYVQNVNGTGSIQSNNALTVNTYYYAVMKRQANGKVYMYLNGVLQTDTYTETGSVDNSSPLLIGRDGYMGDNEWYKGEIEEVRIQRGIDRGDAWVATMSNQILSSAAYIITENTISASGNVIIPSAVTSATMNIAKTMTGNIVAFVPYINEEMNVYKHVSATGNIDLLCPSVFSDGVIGEYYPYITFNVIEGISYNSQPCIVSATVSYQFAITSADGLEINSIGRFTGNYKQTALNQYIAEISVSASGTLVVTVSGRQDD